MDQISGAKRKQNLTEHAEAARISKQLATIVRDVPVELDLEGELAREPDRSRLREIFREWELRDPLRRLEEALEAADAAAIPRPETLTARTVAVRAGGPADLPRLTGAELALIAEAPEVPEGELLPRAEGWRFGAYAGGPYALAGEVEDPARLVAAAGDRPVIGHDAKALGEVPANLAFDTEVAAYLLDPARRGYPLEELCEERGMAVEADDPLAARAVLAHELAGRQLEQIRERGLEHLLREIELPLVRVLRETEKAGIKLDTRRLEEVALRIRADAAALEREIWDLAGEEFMIGSTQQLAEVLFVKLGLSRKRRGKTGFSTDARVLQAIRDEHPIVEKVERFRELSKLAQTYLEQLPAAIGPDGRLHTTLQQTNTATGRLSSINPNLQNIPIRTETGREIRACFIAEPGNVLISVDYSQVELRVLAHIAGEQVLKDIFLRGEDVHTETAAAVFDTPPDQLTVAMRSKAKMVNYGIVYGLSAYGLADRLRIPQEEAQEFIDRYLERFPAVARFMAEAVEQAEQHGYVSTLFGRRRQIPELRARNWQTRKLGERLAVNTVIQGTAADIIKVAMVHCHDALAAAGLATRVILQIHDELLFEGPAEEAEARRGDRLARDGGGRRARPAAGGRRRRRAELARREVGQAAPELDRRAAVHGDEEPGGPGARGGGVVDHAELEPDRLRADGDRLVHVAAGVLGAAEDVDDVDRLRHLAQRRVARPPEHLAGVRVDRHDVVPAREEEARHAVGGAAGIGRAADDRPAAAGPGSRRPPRPSQTG